MYAYTHIRIYAYVHIRIYIYTHMGMYAYDDDDNSDDGDGDGEDGLSVFFCDDTPTPTLFSLVAASTVCAYTKKANLCQCAHFKLHRNRD